MKQRILVVALTAAMLGMVGCSSTQNAGINPGSSATTGVADQRLATSDFKRQGVRITYTLGGEIESIEATGYAPVWGNSQNAAREAFRVAELEAKKSLNDFINKETITSTTSVKMISNNLEHAQDNNNNKFANNLATTDTEVTNKTGTEENTAIRNNALKIASQLSTTITTQNRGILGGLYLKDAQVIDGGRAVKVVMRWDKKHNDARLQVRGLMAQ